MVIHPRDHALVMGTHGRGVIILDDITPLRQITDEILATPLHFFTTQPTVLRDPGAGGGWFGGAGNFVAGNPNTNAQIIYYMAKRHTFGKMYLQVYDDQGNMIRELPAGKSAGINIVTMPTALKKPKSAPTNNRMALFGSLGGPNLAAGTYSVKLIKKSDTMETSFTLQYDPESPYSKSDRELQRETTLKLYNMSEDIAYYYYESEALAEQLEARASDAPALEDELIELKARLDTFRNGLVAMGGDFYVDEGEELRERVSDLYRLVLSYPGRPSESQLSRAEILLAETAGTKIEFEELSGEPLAALNKKLAENDASPVELNSREAFLKGETSSTGGSYKNYQKQPLQYFNW